MRKLKAGRSFFSSANTLIQLRYRVEILCREAMNNIGEIPVLIQDKDAFWHHMMHKT